MTTGRGHLVVEGIEGVYHCLTRCVRRAYLSGKDPYSDRSLDDRLNWIRDRIESLASVFALDVGAYAVMPTGYHLVVRTRPDRPARWSPDELARRWLTAFPRKREPFGALTAPEEGEIKALAGKKETLADLSGKLSSLSWFMRNLNEYIARRANREDEQNGRFWEGRFKCRSILDESAILVCLAHVDLKPIIDGLAGTPEEINQSSFRDRTETRKAAKPKGTKRAKPAPAGGWLGPIGDEIEGRRGLTSLTLGEYADLVDWTGRQVPKEKSDPVPDALASVLDRTSINKGSWVSGVRGFGRTFHTAAGGKEAMQDEARRLGVKWLRGSKAGGDVFSS